MDVPSQGEPLCQRPGARSRGVRRFGKEGRGRGCALLVQGGNTQSNWGIGAPCGGRRADTVKCRASLPRGFCVFVTLLGSSVKEKL